PCPWRGQSTASSAVSLSNCRRTRLGLLAERFEGVKEAWAVHVTGSPDPLPPFEGRDIFGCKVEPLALASFTLEPLVPVGFYADRIICLDAMQCRGRDRNFYRQLPLPAADRHVVANLVVTA